MGKYRHCRSIAQSRREWSLRIRSKGWDEYRKTWWASECPGKGRQLKAFKVNGNVLKKLLLSIECGWLKSRYRSEHPVT